MKKMLKYRPTSSVKKLIPWAWIGGLLLPFVFSYLSFAQYPSRGMSVLSRGQAKHPDTSGTIRLAALDNDLLIQWTACAGCTYRYQMQGIDSDTVGYDFPVARYTNLEGGTYQFWVQTFQNNRWQPPLKLRFEVEQTLTETLWFWPSVAFYGLLLIGAGIYFFLLYNFRQKLKMHHLRNRIAADLHDEVGATLSSIAISTKLVEKKIGQQAPETLEILHRIKTDSQDTIQSIRDTVWALNPDNDSLDQLLEKMRSMAFQLLTPQDIALEFDNQIPPNAPLKLSMEQRRNIYLIFKEALNNIVKYAEASKVRVEFKIQSVEFWMSIADNGKGFDTSQRYEGNGLKNYQKRAQESFMEVILTSKVGEGTRLELKAP
jgi:signal transduction histidine kinase